MELNRASTLDVAALFHFRNSLKCSVLYADYAAKISLFLFTLPENRSPDINYLGESLDLKFYLNITSSSKEVSNCLWSKS